MSETHLPTTEPAVTGDIVARAARYYRMTRYLIIAMLLGWGGWSIWDGFFKWPADSAKYDLINSDMIAAEKAGNQARKNELAEELKNYKKHTDLDIFLNKLFGVAFPPLALFMLWWTLHNSRGEIRLSGDTLTVPGHPPVTLDQLTELDRKLWDRKGIAWVNYQTADGKEGEFKLDDFVYERKPIDQIYDRILARFEPAGASGGDGDAGDGEAGDAAA
ncbi:MAG TPA: hypothetical protein PLD59_12775 [Tepidisphaeraceae bacterium]|nr:hypothetical protein [Tepidisphaeraceae bacterium]